MEIFEGNKLMVNESDITTENDRNSLFENAAESQNKEVILNPTDPKEGVEQASELIENRDHELFDRDNSVIVGETHTDDVQPLANAEKFTATHAINFQNSPKIIPVNENASACEFDNPLDQFIAKNLLDLSKSPKVAEITALKQVVKEGAELQPYKLDPQQSKNLIESIRELSNQRSSRSRIQKPTINTQFST